MTILQRREAAHMDVDRLLPLERKLAVCISVCGLYGNDPKLVRLLLTMAVTLVFLQLYTKKRLERRLELAMHDDHLFSTRRKCMAP